MESDEPGVLGPMLFLLFVMPPPLLSAGSFWPSIIGWRNLNHHLSQDWDGFNQSASYQRSQTNPQHIRICDGAFDLYFLVDTSENMENNWKEIYTYVNEMVKKYTNPKLRMSFVTYSTHGQTLMTLTSDRNTIRKGLTKLQNIVPSGDINMQEGMKKVNEQLQQVYSRDNKAASLIITLTAGKLSPKTIYETANEAHKARKMGAKIYNVGLKGYSRKQLIQIIEGYNKMYESKDYNSMDDFVNSLIENSCLDVMGKETYFVCVKEVYNLGFNTHALQRDRLNEYVCRYNLDDTMVYTKEATNMTNEKLICPGHVFEKAGQVVIVDYSLNSGVKFQDSTLKVTSRNCKIKKSPPVQDQKKKPKTCHIQTCPTVIVPCYGCQEDRIQWVEGKLDTLCDFVQNCNQVSLMWHQPRDKGKCLSITPVKPHCAQTPCGPKICLAASQECSPLNSCCSLGQNSPQIWSQPSPRMLPLIPPPTQALHRTTLSLPPP
ncbi:hypothetical protein HJG60_010875 [Phyllostomus discolor]|uniref:VWFA domain-containing protein n=1 Tax=Phyllostomus discolor TaxID=89673 RepID=A0A834AER2_9CHIR|nr:hypothetical protein HJG60_010875 [Phyllostomus discolor]